MASLYSKILIILFFTFPFAGTDGRSHLHPSSQALWNRSQAKNENSTSTNGSAIKLSNIKKTSPDFKPKEIISETPTKVSYLENTLEYPKNAGNAGFNIVYPNISKLFLPKFDCSFDAFNFSDPVPDSVFALRPQDIRVVMALGDSITAGFGSLGKRDWFFQNLYEHRGSSFSAGDGLIPLPYLHPNNTANVSYTIPSILKMLRNHTVNNSFELIGASSGEHLVEICYGRICPNQHRPFYDKLNAAMSGAVTEDLDSHEIQYLIKQYQASRVYGKNRSLAVDQHIYDDDWSLLTILIGANDVCLACGTTPLDVLANGYRIKLQSAFSILQSNFSRVFVNIVQLFNVSQVVELSNHSQECVRIHSHLPIECTCAFQTGEKGIIARRAVDKATALFNQILVDVSREAMENITAQHRQDMAFVVQPAFSNFNVSQLPLEFLSNLDCFHPSSYSHQFMALHLWNNMISPSSKKSTGKQLTETFQCPDPKTLLYTF